MMSFYIILLKKWVFQSHIKTVKKRKIKSAWFLKMDKIASLHFVQKRKHGPDFCKKVDSLEDAANTKKMIIKSTA